VLILLRHGQTATNAQGLLVGRSDPPLTELGRTQARALASVLENVGALVSSPLRRARETAALAVPQRTAVIDDAFIEVDYGTLEGTSLASVPAPLWRSFATDHDVALGGGESLADVDRRVHARLQEWMDDATSLLHSASEHLVVVSHVSPIKSALAWALGAPGSIAWRSQLVNGSLTTITSRRGEPVLINFNVVPQSHQ